MIGIYVAVSAWVLLAGCSEDRQTSLPANARTSAPPSVRNFDDPSRFRDSSIEVIAFGDFGTENSVMTSTMSLLHAKFPTPDLVFLLGDNTYKHVASPKEYTLFANHVARGSNSPHYAVMGNYEYKLNSDQTMLKMGAWDSRWIMPSAYYFKKFTRATFTVCVWFIDTDKFVVQQTHWLDASIAKERRGCTWTVVAGHHPGQVQASGPTMGNKRIDRHLQPILDKYGVDVNLCGHHHNSQHLTNLPHRTHTFIAGQISSVHGAPTTAVKGQLVWGSAAEPAFLRLKISATQMIVEFHSGRRPASSGPIHSQILTPVTHAR